MPTDAEVSEAQAKFVEHAIEPDAEPVPDAESAAERPSTEDDEAVVDDEASVAEQSVADEANEALVEEPDDEEDEEDKEVEDEDGPYALPSSPEPSYSSVAAHIEDTLLGLLNDLTLPDISETFVLSELVLRAGHSGERDTR